MTVTSFDVAMARYSRISQSAAGGWICPDILHSAGLQLPSARVGGIEAEFLLLHTLWEVEIVGYSWEGKARNEAKLLPARCMKNHAGC